MLEQNRAEQVKVMSYKTLENVRITYINHMCIH